ncbi:MAG: autotransporter outer membrane beta-barrel domain-containing protein [Akkermansia sp.]
MKLHIPVKLLSALLACVLLSPPSSATTLVAVPNQQSSAAIASAQVTLSTPCLGDDSCYRLRVLQAGDSTAGIISVNKYLYYQDSDSLAIQSYALDFQYLGSSTGTSGQLSLDTLNGPINITVNRNLGDDQREISSTNATVSRDFIGISYSNTQDVNGGAFLNNSNRALIEGDFINNSLSANSGTNRGGGLCNYNNKQIQELVAHFVGNSVVSAASTYGGGLANLGVIDSINGDFIANRLNSQSAENAASGGALYNSGDIGTIQGDFISNDITSTHSVAGGAIFLAQYGTIGRITGDFSANIIQSSNGYAYGGAIAAYATSDSIQAIEGDFSHNTASSTTGDAKGGAIFFQSGLIKSTSISGHFVFNTAQSVTGQSYGGAVYNDGCLSLIDSSFFNNTAGAGGAVYNATAGILNIIAEDSDSVFSHNTAGSGDGSDGIYNASGGVINLLAANNQSITLNDKIYNEGQISIGATAYQGEILLNSRLSQASNGSLILNQGTLRLGSAADVSSCAMRGNGGHLSLQNDALGTQQFQSLTLAGEMTLGIDLQFSTKTADILDTLSLNTSGGSIAIQELSLMDAMTDTRVIIQVANDNLKDVMKIADTMNIIASQGDSTDYSIFDITYNAADGTISFAFNDVEAGITADIANKELVLSDDTVLSGKDLTMGGDELTITAQCKRLDSNGGLLTITANQDLILNGMKEWQGDIDNSGTIQANLGACQSMVFDGSILGDGLVAVAGTGSVTFTDTVEGDLSLSADTSLKGALDVDGELRLDGALNIVGPASEGPFVSVGSINSSTAPLDIKLDDEFLSSIPFGADDSYELLQSDTGITSAVTVGGGSSFVIDNVGLVDVDLAANGTSIALNLVDSSNFWMSTDGTWNTGGHDDWVKDVPSSTDVASFTGQGTSDVNLTDAQNVKTIVVDSENKDYRFDGAQLSADDMHLVAGAVSLNNVVIVDHLLDIKDKAALSVGATGKLTTDTLSISSDFQAGVSGFDNQGSTTVKGDLNAQGVSLNNDGTLIVHDGHVGNITGTGKLQLSGTLSMDSDYSLSEQSYASTGCLDLGTHTASINDRLTSGGSLVADSVIVTANAGGVFDSITTNYLELTDLSTTQHSLTLNDALSTTTQPITLHLADLTTATPDGEYLLIKSGNRTGFSSDSFSLSSTNAALVTDLLMNSGIDVYFDTDDGNLNLVVSSDPNNPNAPRYIWDTKNDFANSSKLPGVEFGPLVDAQNNITHYNILDFVDEVHVTEDQDIKLTQLVANDADGLRISNLQGLSTAELRLIGDDNDIVSLFNNQSTEAKNTLSASKTELIVDNDGRSTLSLAELDLQDAQLQVLAGAAFTVNRLLGDHHSSIQGQICIDGDGAAESSYSGSYHQAEVWVKGGTANFDLGVNGGAELDLSATQGAQITLAQTQHQSIKAFNINDGASLSFTHVGSDALNLLQDSSVTKASINILLDGAPWNERYCVLDGAKLSLNEVTINLSSSSTTMDISAIKDLPTVELVELTNNAASDDADVSVSLSSIYDKYFTNAKYVDGVIVASLRRDSYSDQALTPNGQAGLDTMGDILIDINPQHPANRDDNKDLAQILDDLDTYKQQGDKLSADRLGAAIAGAGVASIGSATLADIERQLRSMRNRNNFSELCYQNIEYLAPRGFWIAAEGANSSLDDDRTSAGHSFTSWGGSIGYDAQTNAAWRVGGALTAIVGDLSSHAADEADGTLKNYYASLYANKKVRNWTHSFVASIGMMESELDRNITTSTGKISTGGDTDGFNLALSYQLGYKYYLSEYKCSTIQPLVGISMVHSSIGGYTEKGSDASLELGKQSTTYVTFSGGAQWDALGGEHFINRKTRYTAHVLLNIDAGKRQSELEANLLRGNQEKFTIKGADVGQVGVELGTGISIPVSPRGNIFADLSYEFRTGMNDCSATLGYRFSF